MKLRYQTLCAALLAANLAGCGGGGSSTSSNNSPSTPNQSDSGFSYAPAAMVTQITNEVIVSGYASLASGADALNQKAMDLFNAPTADNLAAAQQAWRNVRVAWEQGESHIFGPVDALSIDPHLDTWPLNTQDLQSLLDNQSGFSASEIQTWNDDVQGFHTMEFLLFGDGVADNDKSIDQMTAAEREYLVACAEVFAEYAHNLADAWTVSQNLDNQSAPYADSLLEPGNNNYASYQEVVSELIGGMIGIVDEVGHGKIAEPFGSSLDSADTSKVESQYSWNSLSDFANNITGVRNVYRGELASDADGAGLIDFVAAADADLAQRIDDEITASIDAILAIGGDTDMPFRQAILDTEGRVRVQNAIDQLNILQTSLEQDVVPLLGQWTAE